MLTSVAVFPESKCCYISQIKRDEFHQTQVNTKEQMFLNEQNRKWSCKS